MTTKLTLVETDICTLAVDGIVNAANQSLLGGGGVDGAIHRAAGPQLLEACRQLQGCETGKAKITPGFNLPARYVIHTVGPIFQAGHAQQAAQLADCYRNAIALATQYQLKTLAFPAISTGAYGYPENEACKIAVEAITEACSEVTTLRKVYLCAVEPRIYNAWLQALQSSTLH